MVYIIAGTRAQFDHFIRTNPDFKLAVYVTNVWKLRGVARGSKVILIGTWGHRRDLGDLFDEVKWRGLDIDRSAYYQ